MDSGCAMPDETYSATLDKLIAGTNDVAATARTILTAMLVVAVTMAATMIAATDEALLRDSAEVFPNLGVKIKLSTAYVMAPIIFAFLHANALLQLHLLWQRLDGVEVEMRQLGINTRECARWRRTIHGLAFAQLMLGRENHDGSPLLAGVHRLLMAFLSWVAIVAVPVILLVTAQVSFVRYQSSAITAVHQVVLTLDLLLLFWFHLAHWGQLVKSPWLSSGWSAAAALAAAFLLWLSWGQAIPPQPTEFPKAVRWIETDEGKATWSNSFGSWVSQVVWPALTEDGVNFLDRFAVKSSWTWVHRYLDLSHRTLINSDAKPELVNSFAASEDERAALQRSMVVLDLRGRIFRFAIFDQVQLFSADLQALNAENSSWNGAILNGARLDDSHIEGASFIGASLKNVRMPRASAAGAKFLGGTLAGSFLFYSDFRGAHFSGVDLSAASLMGANLNGATFQNAKIIGTRFDIAKLSGVIIQNSFMDFAYGDVSANCNGRTDFVIDNPKFKYSKFEDLVVDLKKDGASLFLLLPSKGIVPIPIGGVLNITCGNKGVGQWGGANYDDVNRVITLTACENHYAMRNFADDRRVIDFLGLDEKRKNVIYTDRNQAVVLDRMKELGDGCPEFLASTQRVKRRMEGPWPFSSH